MTKEKDYAIFKLEMKKICLMISFLAVLVSSTFALEIDTLKREYGKVAETLLPFLSLNPTAYLYGYNSENIPNGLLEKFFPDLLLGIEEKIEETEEEIKEVNYAFISTEEKTSPLPQLSSLASQEEEKEFYSSTQKEEIKRNLFPQKSKEVKDNLDTFFKKKEEETLLNFTEFKLSPYNLPKISIEEINSEKFSWKIPETGISQTTKILTTQEIIPVYSPQPYEFKLTAVKFPKEQELPEPYIPSLENNNPSSLSLPSTEPQPQTSPQASLPFNLSLSSLSSETSALSSLPTPSPKPEGEEDKNLLFPIFLPVSNSQPFFGLSETKTPFLMW